MKRERPHPEVAFLSYFPELSNITKGKLHQGFTSFEQSINLTTGDEEKIILIKSISQELGLPPPLLGAYIDYVNLFREQEKIVEKVRSVIISKNIVHKPQTTETNEQPLKKPTVHKIEERVLELANNNLAVYEVANELSVGRNLVREIFRKHGFPTKTERKAKKDPLSDDQKQIASHLYYNKRFTYQGIWSELVNQGHDVTGKQVEAFLETLERRELSEQTYPLEIIKRVKELREQKLKKREIAKILSEEWKETTTNQVAYILRVNK